MKLLEDGVMESLIPISFPTSLQEKPMSLRIRFKFDGRCSVHSRYNPEKDGTPQHRDCPGCEALYVIWLYSGIAQKKAEKGEGLLRSCTVRTAGDDRPNQPESGDEPGPQEEAEAAV
jgi:hypothetical protein